MDLPWNTVQFFPLLTSTSWSIELLNNYYVLLIIEKGEHQSKAADIQGESCFLDKKTSLKENLAIVLFFFLPGSLWSTCGIEIIVFWGLNFVILSARECDHLKGKLRSLHMGQICINRLFLLSVHLPSCPWSHPRSACNHGNQTWSLEVEKKKQRENIMG